MAGIYIYTATLNHSTFPSRCRASSPPKVQHSAAESRKIDGRDCFARTGVSSSHSNPRILKPNRRSRYRQTLSTCPVDDEDEFGGASDDVDEDGDDLLSDDELEVEISDVDRRRLQLKGSSSKGQGRIYQPGSINLNKFCVNKVAADKQTGKSPLVLQDSSSSL